MSDWSPYNTKAQLLEVAKERGLSISSSMLKADIIDALKISDYRIEAQQEESFDEPTPVETPLSKKDPTPEASELTFGVLDYLAADGGRVSFKQLIADCGKEAKEEVKALVAQGKVTQYKKHNSFWFEVA